MKIHVQFMVIRVQYFRLCLLNDAVVDDGIRGRRMLVIQHEDEFFKP